MPNKPRPENRARPVRIEDDLWAAVQKIAADDKATPSEVVRESVPDRLKSFMFPMSAVREVRPSDVAPTIPAEVSS